MNQGREKVDGGGNIPTIISSLLAVDYDQLVQVLDESG